MGVRGVLPLPPFSHFQVVFPFCLTPNPTLSLKSQSSFFPPSPPRKKSVDNDKKMKLFIFLSLPSCRLGFLTTHFFFTHVFSYLLADLTFFSFLIHWYMFVLYDGN